MDNITICIIIAVVVIFLAVIYIYKDYGETVETLEKERKEMETRLCDEISDLKRIANKATVASEAASAAATAASLSAKSTKETFSLAIGSGGDSRAPPRGAPRAGPGAMQQRPPATGAAGLPEGLRAAISSAQEKGMPQDQYAVAEKMFNPNEAKTVSPATAAAMASKNRVAMPESTGMEEAPMPQTAAAPPPIPQMFGPSTGTPPPQMPGINYDAIAQGFATDQSFSVDSFGFDLGDPNAEFVLN